MKASHYMSHSAPTRLGNFARVYALHFRRIYRYFLYRTGYNHEAAIDLTQETFLRAFRHYGEFKEEGFQYLTYLMTIAHNLLVNYYRKPKSVPLSDIPDEEVVVTNGNGSVEALVKDEDLERAISHLTPLERAAVSMEYTKGFSIKDIAHHIGKSVTATKLLLFRARNKIRTECGVPARTH